MVLATFLMVKQYLIRIQLLSYSKNLIAKKLIAVKTCTYYQTADIISMTSAYFHRHRKENLCMQIKFSITAST